MMLLVWQALLLSVVSKIDTCILDSYFFYQNELSKSTHATHVSTNVTNAPQPRLAYSAISEFGLITN